MCFKNVLHIQDVNGVDQNTQSGNLWVSPTAKFWLFFFSCDTGEMPTNNWQEDLKEMVNDFEI